MLAQYFDVKYQHCESAFGTKVYETEQDCDWGVGISEGLGEGTSTDWDPSGDTSGWEDIWADESYYLDENEAAELCKDKPLRGMKFTLI